MNNAPAKQSDVPKSVKAWLSGDYLRQQMALVLPKHCTAERMVRVALTALIKNPDIGKCTPESVMQCMLALSALGLEPDGRLAHLIPYGRTCTLIVDYKGLVKLAKQSGDISNIYAQVVCNGDQFTYDTGQIKHIIDFKAPRGDMYAAYVIITFKDGTNQTDVMTKAEIDTIRKRSPAGSKGPWCTDYNEMAKKTVFRRASKWITLSPELADALDKDADAPASLVTEATVKVVPEPEDDLTYSDLSQLRGSGMETQPEPSVNTHAATEANVITVAEEGPRSIAGSSPARATNEKPKPEPPPPPKPSEPVGEKIHTVQDSLREIVEGGGFTFDHFRKWANETGNLPDADSLTSWDEVPVDVCKRMTRAKVGLLKGLDMLVKGVAI